MTAQQSADRLYAILDALRGCLCGTTDLEAGLCSCVLLPRRTGDCGCAGARKNGTAWVRLTGLYPSTAFPVQNQAKANCGSVLAATVELGILRSVPTVDSKGGAPSTVELAAATRQQVSDAMAMWAAYSCCGEFTSRDYVLGAYAPTDAGDCAGGVWPATVHLTREPTP